MKVSKVFKDVAMILVAAILVVVFAWVVYPQSRAESGVVGSVALVGQHDVLAAEFSDVPNDHWAYNIIDACVNEGLIRGFEDGTFHPGDTLTYAQFMALVERACFSTDVANQESKMASDDVWYAPYLAIAVEKGLVDGSVADHMNEGIPRVQMAYMVYNALCGNLGFNVEPEEKFMVAHLYNEGVTVNVEEAATVINTCATLGIINGYPDGSFGAMNTLTRAEAAAVTYRVLNVVKGGPTDPAPTEKPEPTKTPDPVVNNVHVPVPDHVKQNLQTPIYKLSREDAQEAIGWQFCVEVNKFRSQHGLYELDWNDTISGGLQRCNARKESATIDPYLASGGTKKLLEDMDFDNTLYPVGLKPFFRESRDNFITIDSYSTPVTIARQIMNELYDAGLGYELFAVDGDRRVEALEVKIYPYSWSDNLPTIFGAGIQFSTTAANWWESYFFQWAVGGPSDRHCRFDRDYKELGYTFF